MDVIAHSRTENDEGRALARYVSLDEALSRSDVLSLHCPAFPETTGIINKETIARMKDGAILINTSRGALVVEEDLAAALNISVEELEKIALEDRNAASQNVNMNMNAESAGKAEALN